MKKKPMIFHVQNTVLRPGDSVCVRGEWLDGISSAELSDGVKTRALELLQHGRQSFKFAIPEELREGMFTLTLKFDGGELTRFLNAPVVRWVQGDEGAFATPDGWVRVIGECLRVRKDASPSLTIDGKKLSPSRVYDDYSVGFELSGLTAGERSAVYSNGFAECDVTVKVAESPEKAWPKKVYNVLDEGLTDDTVTDCTEPLKALLEKVGKEGGGIVYFPSGRYHLTGCFHIPRNTVLRGDGFTKSQIFWTDEWHEERVLEDGKKHFMPTELPKVMITGDGDFAIEDLDFAASRIGGLINAGTPENPADNIRIDRVRVMANSFAGSWLHARHGQYNYIGRCEVLKETMMDQTDMLKLCGSNIKVRGCDFLWSGRPFSFSGGMNYPLIQSTKFGGATAVDDWLPFGTLNNAIIEDCEIHEWTSGFGGNNIYFARTIMKDVVDNNREAFTTDIASGINYHGTAEINGCDFIFPKDVDMAKARVGSILCVLSGTGAGQWRKVAAVDGHRVTVEAPFDAQPDETSHLTVNSMFSNWYFVGIRLDNGGSLQFYTAQANTVVDGMKITRSGGVKCYGHYVYKGIGNNWYNSIVNNEISDGNYYHMGGWYFNKELPASSFLCASGTGGDDTLNIGCTIRGNRLTEHSMIYIEATGESGFTDLLIDNNEIIDGRCGVYISGKPKDMLMTRNRFEDLKQDVIYR